MIKNIKAIPVTYKGIQFRSKLEAKVALFLDECDIPYQYELDSFTDGERGYMPDFYLPRSDAYIEVKGKRPGYEDEILKAISFVGDEIKILIIMSEIPDVDRRGWIHFPVAYNGGVLGTQMGWWFFQDGCDPHITAARYPRPLIIPKCNKVESIEPVSDWILQRCKNEWELERMLNKNLSNKDIEYIFCQEARETWANEEDHWPFETFESFFNEFYDCVTAQDINPITTAAFRKARAERFDEWLDKKRTRP